MFSSSVDQLLSRFNSDVAFSVSTIMPSEGQRVFQNTQVANRQVLRWQPMPEAAQGDEICPGLWKRDREKQDR